MNLEELNKHRLFVFSKEELREAIEISIKELMEKQTVEKVWITPKAAMNMMNIKSRTTLNILINNSKLIVTQPLKKIVLINRESVLNFLRSKTLKSF